MNAVQTHDERARLGAVRRYEILDTPPEGCFDRVAAMAATIVGTPIALISIVDSDRIWFKSHHGLGVNEISRVPGLCASAILDGKPYIVTDALNDPRTADNPLVTGDFGLRFYVAAPLRTKDGFNLGALSVLDHTSHGIDGEHVQLLEDLAAVVMDQMELRSSARSAVSDLSTALDRAEMMGREIDHRVKNSLQFVAGMLDMQSRGAANLETSRALDIAASRVGTVARIHEHFYLDEQVETTCAHQYARRLVGDLELAIGGVSILLAGGPTPISTILVMPLGLIINELVTNAAKYGARAVLVEVSGAGAGVRVEVSDNGPGLPNDFDPETSKGLGMRLIQLLIKQHNGALEYGSSRQGGARIVATLG